MPHRTPLRMLFPPVPAFHLRDESAALLVLDLQPFMTDRSVGLGRLAEERGVAAELDEYFEQVGYCVRNVADLVAAFRARNLPIVFTRLAAVDGASVSPAAYGGALPAPDSPQAQILPELAPRPDAGMETVLVKASLSPFAGADLDAVLQRLGSRTLVVAGVMAGWAVELAAREAADRGYHVLVAADACAGETFEIHGFVMPQLVGGLIRVRSTEAVLEMLDGART